MLRFKVARLHKEGFVHIEGTIKFVILVPLVLHVVDLVVHGRVGKVELTDEA